MRLWHNTEDAPRLPQNVREGDRVEVWIASWPLGHWHHLKVDWKVMHRNGSMEAGSVPAFWKCHDLGRGQNYWLAQLGPFLEGDRVEYTVGGMSCVEDFARQVFAFNIEEKDKTKHGQRPRMRNEDRRGIGSSHQRI